MSSSSNTTTDSFENLTELFFDSEDDDDEQNFNNFEEFLRSLYLQLISHAIITITSLVSLIAGAISWAKLTKWRTFKNYVFLNAILATFFHNFFGVTYMISFMWSYDLISSFGDLYYVSAFPYNIWILIMNIMFYSALVKIYDPPATRRYLKAFLAGWVAPVALSVAISILQQQLSMYDIDAPVVFITMVLTVCLIMFINSILYVGVVWSLLKFSRVRRSKGYVCAKIQVATLLFVISGVGSLALEFANDPKKNTDLYQILVENITFIPSLAISLCLYVSKSNRRIWTEYYEAKFRKSTNTTIDMC